MTGVPVTAAGSFGLRNTPTLTYLAYDPLFTFVVTMTGSTFTEIPTGGFYLDGSAETLYDQALAAFLAPREMNMPDSATLAASLQAAGYNELFRAVYGQDVYADADVTYDVAADAVVAYEKTAVFAPFSSKFDATLAGTATFSDQEQQGYSLFTDPTKGNCISCHVGDPTSTAPTAWLFTNFTYAALGAPRNSQIPDNADPTFFDLGLCNQPGIASREPFGFDLTILCGDFRIPTLRNVALTAPYMHNGSIAALRDAVKFHVTRDSNPELWYPMNADGTIDVENDPPSMYAGNLATGLQADGSPSLTDDDIDALLSHSSTPLDRYPRRPVVIIIRALAGISGLCERGRPMHRPFALPGARPRYAPDRVVHVEHYRIDIAVHFDERKIGGRCAITVSPFLDDVRRLTLDAVEMEVSAVTGEDDRALVYRHDGKKLEIDFAEPLTVGRSQTITVVYTARPRRGLYFNAPDTHYPNRPRQVWTQGQDEDSRHWFPCFDSPHQKSTTEVIATVPMPFFALSNGALVSKTEAGGTRTFHWKFDVLPTRVTSSPSPPASSPRSPTTGRISTSPITSPPAARTRRAARSAARPR